MDASFVTTSKRLQRLCNFKMTKIHNQSHLYMFFFFIKVAKASERKCPQCSKAPTEPQLYALIVKRGILLMNPGESRQYPHDRLMVNTPLPALPARLRTLR